REKRLAGLQGDRGVGTVGEKHHNARPAFCGAARPAPCGATALVLALEDGAEEMVRAEIGDPGQRAAHDIAALDLAPFQLEFLDAEKTLHRVREPGAAENLPASELVGEFGGKLRIAGIRGVPDQRVLAPCHESGGAADFAEGCDRLNGAAQIGCAILRLMAAPCAYLDET